MSRKRQSSPSIETPPATVPTPTEDVEVEIEIEESSSTVPVESAPPIAVQAQMVTARADEAVKRAPEVIVIEAPSFDLQCQADRRHRTNCDCKGSARNPF
jgi:hypothetical protein